MDESLAEEPSVALLERARGGDREALDVLLARYLPRLRQWARGRVPAWARDAGDTDDLVQDTLADSLRRLDRFEYRHEGALQAYFRQALLNRVRSKFRRAVRRPPAAALDDSLAGGDRSPLEAAIGQQMIERYETALASLDADDRELVIARVEMGYTHDELAAMFGKPSRDAARMAVARALVRVAEAMRDGR